MSARISELIRGVYNSGEGIIWMPFGIIARWVQFVQFTISIVMRVKMARRKRDDKDSTGDPSKEKKSKEKVKEVRKKPARKNMTTRWYRRWLRSIGRENNWSWRWHTLNWRNMRYLCQQLGITSEMTRQVPYQWRPLTWGGSVCWNHPMRSWSITCCSAVIRVMGRTEHK